VLTDGRIIIDDRGVETKHFHVRDGQGISLLKHCGIDVGFITGRSSKVVRHRAQELRVSLVFQGVQDKLLLYEQIKKKTRLTDEQIAYVGDDIIDLPVLRCVGLAVMVGDGSAELKPHADMLLARAEWARCVKLPTCYSKPSVSGQICLPVRRNSQLH
jgi:3-deoxy-D-manno-octulosonate 8-phosphate phosphatase (KDO 8-P phosphatase)